MVKNAEDPYSFHLDSTGESLSSGSSTTTSTLCKEKIDRIFAEKRRTILGLPKGIPSAFSNREEQEKFKQHLQSQIQRIVNERRRGVEKELVKDPAPSKNGYDHHIDKLFSEAFDAHDTPSIAESGSVSLSVSMTPSNSSDVSFESTSGPMSASVRPGQGRRLPPDPPKAMTKSNPALNVTTDDETASTIDPGYGIFYQHTRTKVEYLGCLPLNDKATHLEVLQLPLKQLYFQHLALTARGQSPLRGTVEITGTGIKLQYYREERAGVQEIFNPFPTIAVWAAVKFVVRKPKFAFLPLICDPESQEKHKLFHDLDEVPSVLDLSNTVHPPLFACVMRKVGLSRTLECHGFACSSSEDAIVLAANLYQALLDNMKEDNSAGNVYGESSLDSRQSEEKIPVGRPRSASINHSHLDELRGRSEESQPVPPPRKKRGQIYEANYAETGSQLGPSKRSVSEEALTRTEAIAFKKEAKERMSARGTRESRVKRSASDRHHAGFLTDSESTGDIYTRVALPRSKSFMNISGQYDLKDLFIEMKARKLHSVDDLLKEIINPKGMSFSEMKPVYRDLLLKLALTLSKDEIYQRSKNIMRKHNKKKGHMGGLMGLHTPQDSDTDGSSISNVFKATKRSLSKFTSMRQKPSEKRYNVAAKAQANWRSQNNRSKSSENLADVNIKAMKEALKEVTSGSLSGLSTAASKSSDHHQKSQPRKKTHAPPPPPPTKLKTPLPNRKLPPLPVEACSSSECGYDSESCESDTKCYCSLKHDDKHKKGHKDKASPEPCKCDSDSCAESEKCYCSLRVKTKDGTKFYTIALDSGTETDTTVHSTMSSNSKKKHGGSVGNLSGLDSPLTAWRKNSGMNGSGYISPDRSPSHAPASRRSSLDPLYIGSMSMFDGHAEKGGLGEPKSTEHEARRRPSMAKPRSKSTDNLSPVEKAMKDSRESNDNHQKKKKMLVVSAVDPSGKVVYQGASDSRHPASNNRRPSFAHKTKSAASAFLGSMLSTGSNGSDEEGSPVVSGTLSSDTLLSFKKTAEIAALFSDVRLNQTTNIVDNDSLYSESSEDDAYSSMQNLTSGQNSLFMFSDTNIENSLGYLP